MIFLFVLVISVFCVEIKKMMTYLILFIFIIIIIIIIIVLYTHIQKG